ncbi:uncharacterized protein LOC123884285 [Trifolium pratense]|uniref:Uncharacterized protein n=2 Tax=Trifolium pratense TaxID=57577 RepID=A0ACB0JJY7_TRIPR|nr:uncharacterized protein LOC123884285 [Trifolium pratense]XP_045789311.1 uncharacterized protein LOC123884285 [Trifolium pratense]XP_045789312.1 uncharacterized protein LOC123884285 [Trifolium pratense]XP_045789313.1 uncharacterized protein LOC123884285 [Trifolium pratense]CAJ2645417.1 unnamed protein product [Trifolium pratense]CAJ2645419.1 unnamed protein product [Trifolium pratense]
MTNVNLNLFLLIPSPPVKKVIIIVVLGAFTPHLKVLPCTPPSFFSIVPQIKWIDLLEEKISSNGTSGTYEPIDTMKTVKEDDESCTSLPLFEHLYQNVLLYA